MNAPIEEQVSKVRQALEREKRVPNQAVRVTAHRETVELHGTLPSYRMARTAMDAAVRAVRRPVRSHLRVSPRTHGDRAMGRKIRARLERHPEVDATTIVSRVRDGTVALDGYVRTAQSRSLVRDIARSVAGVHRIDCRIVVDPQQYERDKILHAKLIETVRGIDGFETCELGVAAGRVAAYGVSPDVDPWQAERDAREQGAVSLEVV